MIGQVNGPSQAFSACLNYSPLRNPHESAMAWLQELHDLTRAVSQDNLKAIRDRAELAPKIEGFDSEQLIEAIKTVSLENIPALHLLIEQRLKSIEFELSRISMSF